MKPYTFQKYLLLLILLFVFQITRAQYSTYVDPSTRILDTYNAKVGSLPGAIDVGSGGAANYSIPLFVAPGTAGMQPAISIVYNSSIDDGVMGRGFAIGGLSEIRRVPQDFYHETNVKGVSLLSTDRFALDSMRLILTSGGNYGANGTEYATEIESFVKVIAHGTTGSGPTWFEVKTKEGKTFEYGNTTDSRVMLSGKSSVYIWRINKAKDSNGNYFTFTYEQTNGESYIKEIKYTGNSTMGLLPYNKIRFSYNSSLRTDQNTRYIAGSQEPLTKLLDSIRIVTEGDSLVREYRFSYNLDFYTHLNQIKEYASDGSYRNATIFGWGETKAQVSDTSSAFNNGIKDKLYFGDFNGDGRTDFVVTENKTSFTSSDKWKLYLANPRGTSFTFINEDYLDSSFKGFVVADVDGNGMDDILRRERESGPQEAFRYYYYNGSILTRGSSFYDIVLPDAPSSIILMPLDLDGDGKLEYLVLTSAKNIYDIIGVAVDAIPIFDSPGSVTIVDFNGDSKKDILVIKNSNSTIYSFDSSTGNFSSIYSSSSFPTINDRIYPGDFNGDKKTDLLYWRSGSGWSLKFSTGADFTTSPNVPSLVNTDPGASTTDNNYYIADFNGDKKDDIAESNKSIGSPSGIKLFFSIGLSFATDGAYSFPKSTINQEYFQTGDFNGDGKKDIFYYDNSSTSNYAYIRFFHKDEIKHLINFISNGLNENTGINYYRLNNGGSFYVKGTGASFPVKDYGGSYYAVSSTWNTFSAEGLVNNEYYYTGAKIHLRGKGFLGFMKMTVNHKIEITKDAMSFSYDPTYYYIRQDTVKHSVGITYNTAKTTIFTNQVYSYGNTRIHPYISRIESMDAVNVIKTITDFSYDAYGNTLSSSTLYKNEAQTANEVSKYLVNAYDSCGNWGIPNKITKTTDSTIYSGESPYIRKSSFQYDSRGNLTVTINDPLKAKAVKKTSFYNDYGLVTRDSVSSVNLASRVTRYEYDAKKRFVTKTTNPLEHYSTATYSSGTGNVLTITDINNKRTTYEYDPFGNFTRITDPLGIISIREIYWGDFLSGPAIYEILSYTEGKPGITETFSGSGQKKSTSTTAINGTINEEFTYDGTGRLYMKKGPHYSNDWSHAPYVTYSYDDYDRILTITSNNNNTYLTYNGRTSTYHYPDGKTKEITINAMKDIKSVKENGDNNLVTNYSYGSNGKVRQVTSAGTIISVTYDEYGNAVSITNPNSGISSTEFDAFGQKVSYTDSKSDAFNYFYDNLGRIDHFTSTEGTTHYYYKSTAGGKEQIASITGPGNISYSYNYDDYGRISQFNENILGEQNLTTSFTYGVHGNDSTMTYPGGYKIKKVYENGYLREIQKANGDRIWRLDSLSTFGGPGRYLLGTGGLKTVFTFNKYNGFLTKKITGIREQFFTFDTIAGNLMSKRYKRGISDRSESYTYDDLDRLTAATGNGRDPAAFTYEPNGNIHSKTGTSMTGVGNYYYNADKINAVDSILNNPGSISLKTQEITYTSFNKAYEIRDSIDKEPIMLEISYGPDQQRVKNVFSQNGTTTKTKYYATGYEKEITTSGTRELYYINCPYGLIAINIRKNNADSLYFVDTDHLGSILALLNADGTEAAEYSYDEWGRRRRPSNWALYDTIPSLGFIDRGYTGHEHYDQFGLIDMNGRVYDPIIGRFLSPDPVIQTPDFTQNYNGYSYCFNNPLKYSDPSGYTVYADPLTAYFYACLDGYAGGLSNFSDQYYNQYNRNSDSGGGGGGSSSMTFTWQEQNAKNHGDLLGQKVIGPDGKTYYCPGTAYVSPTYSTFSITLNVGNLESRGPFKYPVGQGANFDNSNLALDIGGGIYGGLRTTVTPGDQWLGNNGKYYNKSWGGNQYTGSRSGAFAASNTYKWAGRATVGATVIIGGIQVYNGYQMDGGQFGYNANFAGASATGGIIGGWAGAEAGATVGAAIGVWFAGVGAVPGAIIGGFVGGIVGSLTGNKIGEATVNYYYGR
jgi:RHS repeat-associated protein